MRLHKHSQLRQRCNDALRGVDLPSPWSLDRFLADLAIRRNRPIVLAEAPALNTCHGVSAQWWKQPDVDVILYAPTQSIFYLEFNVFHEVAHMLCGHDAYRASLFADDDLQALTAAPGAAALMFARNSRFDSIEEQEAEYAAYRLKLMVERGGHGADDATASHLVHSMRRSLGSEVSR